MRNITGNPSNGNTGTPARPNRPNRHPNATNAQTARSPSLSFGTITRTTSPNRTRPSYTRRDATNSARYTGGTCSGTNPPTFPMLCARTTPQQGTAVPTPPTTESRRPPHRGQWANHLPETQHPLEISSHPILQQRRGQRPLHQTNPRPIRTNGSHRTNTSSHVGPPFFATPLTTRGDTQSPTGQDDKAVVRALCPGRTRSWPRRNPHRGKRSYPLGKLSLSG